MNSVQQPLISVIIPVYNVEKYLSKCIESVINQTYKNLEIILVDDGSTDSSPRICDKYAELDHRIKVIHKINEGPGIARNYGIELSSGDYLGFVDSDDWIETQMLEILIDTAKERNAQIAVCGRNNISDLDNTIISKQFCFEKNFCMLKEEAVKRFCIYDGIDAAMWDKIFHKSLFNNVRFSTDSLIAEDMFVVFKLINSSERVAHAAKPLYNYLQRTGSRSKSLFNINSYGMCYNAKKVKDEVNKCFPEFKREAEHYYLFNLINTVILANKSDNYEAKKKLRKILLSEFKNIIYNNYLTLKYKCISLLCVFNLFLPLYKVYKFFNWRNNYAFFNNNSIS